MSAIDTGGGAAGNAGGENGDSGEAPPVTPDDVRQSFDIVKYGDKAPGFQNHHGIMDVWAKNNIPGYISRQESGPSMALTELQHSATQDVFREWLFDRTGRYVGASIDWTTVSPREILALSESMFDAAGVPDEARQAYYSAFNQYIYTGSFTPLKF